MQNTVIEMINLLCFYFVEMVDLLMSFIGEILGLFMQDYRLFVFFLTCICIVTTTLLIDQIRALGDDIIKWRKEKNKCKPVNRRKSGKNSRKNKSKANKTSSKKDKNKVIVSKGKKDSVKITLNKEIKTPGISQKRKNKSKSA